MADYQPIDISSWCNAGASEIGDGQEAALGRLSLRGLPFLVGPEPIGGSASASCFIALDGTSGGVSIPINRAARRAIMAHRLLESEIASGGPLGLQVAEYVFRLSNGNEYRVPIRERFEIGSLPDVWGGAPFLAVSDESVKLIARHEGPWDQAGKRQVEAIQARPRRFYLWTWENPEPDAIVESLEIVPKGPRFIVAALTLGHVDEHPFARQGRRPVRIILKSPNDAEKPFDLDATVDRGDATYIHPLPQATVDEFVGDSYTGWGEEQNPQSSPAYVEVSAVPSATVTVTRGPDEIGSVNWGEVEEKGQVETPRMRFELLDRGKNWVHVTVLDDDTGKPVPCRVHFRSPEGVPYQPHGHHNQVNSNLDSWHMDVGGDLRLGQITYAYIDGTCQGWLPRGDVIVDVARGFEYEPLRSTVRIEPGQRELTLRIKRWANMNERRWFSGDSHVHFLSSQGALTEAQCEDLNVVNLLQSQWGSLFTNAEDFTGAPFASQSGDHVVYVSQENRQHIMGHMILWGLKKPVMPWCSDGLGEAEIGGTMETTLSHWADEAHAQGAYVIQPHFPFPNGEAAALVATGRLDGVEMIRQAQSNHDEYYRYLNCGYRLPLVGGTDKMSSDVPVGIYRTYVKIPEDQEFSYDNWCRGVAAGRTFLSGGPIISFSVDGREVGDTLELSGAGTVEVAASAESIFPIHRLEIVRSGRVVASTESREGARRLEIRERVKVEGHTWLAARCGGPDYDGLPHYDGWRRGIFAHTSPIYVAVGGEWRMFDPATAQYMLTLIDGDLTYIRDASAQHQPGNITHHHGEADHIAYLERPFHQAREAILKRMEDFGVSL